MHQILVLECMGKILYAIFRIRDVNLDVASRIGNGSLASSVEKCHCPPGYLGYSCEKCEQGYWR